VRSNHPSEVSQCGDNGVHAVSAHENNVFANERAQPKLPQRAPAAALRHDSRSNNL